MIEIKNITKQFQNETEIHYKDIVFETGKSYMLLGASGCGKSTLLNSQRILRCSFPYERCRSCFGYYTFAVFFRFYGALCSQPKKERVLRF